jgi:hypothetical protein
MPGLRGNLKGTIDQLLPAFVVDARSNFDFAAFTSSLMRSTQPLDVSRKKTESILCTRLILGVMFFHSVPPSGVQKSFLFVAAQPISAVSSFIDSIWSACCPSEAAQSQTETAREIAEMFQVVRILDILLDYGCTVFATVIDSRKFR